MLRLSSLIFTSLLLQPEVIAKPGHIETHWVKEILASNPTNAEEFAQMYTRRLSSGTSSDGTRVRIPRPSVEEVAKGDNWVNALMIAHEAEDISKLVAQIDKEAFAKMKSDESSLKQQLLSVSKKIQPRSSNTTLFVRRMPEASQQQINAQCVVGKNPADFYNCVAELKAKTLGGDAATDTNDLPWYGWEISHAAGYGWGPKPDEPDADQRVREMTRYAMEMFVYDVFRGLERSFIEKLGVSQAEAENKLAARLFQEIAIKHWTEGAIHMTGGHWVGTITLEQAKAVAQKVGFTSAADIQALEKAWKVEEEAGRIVGGKKPGDDDSGCVNPFVLIALLGGLIVLAAIVGGVICCFCIGRDRKEVHHHYQQV